MISAIHRNSDEIFSFQLEDENDVIIDVDDITDIIVEVINYKTNKTLVTYSMADITLDNTDNTIYVLIEGLTTENAKLDNYLFKVSWAMIDVNFPDGFKNSVDMASLFRLIK